MFRKTFIIVTAGILSGAALFATGCTSSTQQPYGLTGSNQGIHRTQGEVNRAAEDQKYVGHVAGWRTGVNVPANYH